MDFLDDVKEKEYQALPEDMARLTWLANLGEVAGPLAHELNNFLNLLLLQLHLLEREVPEALRPNLTTIRKQGNQAAALIKDFFNYRRKEQPLRQNVDLNSIIMKSAASLKEQLPGLSGADPRHVQSSQTPLAAEEPARPSLRLQLFLAPDLPLVPGFGLDLQRLCTFLLTNAARALGSEGGDITVRTERQAGKVLLAIDDSGLAPPPEVLPQLFELHVTGREGTNKLELAACRTLVRRLQGTIRAANRAEGGLTITVEIPVAG